MTQKIINGVLARDSRDCRLSARLARLPGALGALGEAVPKRSSGNGALRQHAANQHRSTSGDDRFQWGCNRDIALGNLLTGS